MQVIKAGAQTPPRAYAFPFGFMHVQKSFCVPVSGLHLLQREMCVYGHRAICIHITYNQEFKLAPQREVTRCQRSQRALLFYMF